jgi:hypothetical protein
VANYGINFRATSGYVTDGANETYSLGEATATRGGLTFGWGSDQNSVCRDRSSTNDRRLAGILFRGNSAGSVITFTITLPSTGEWIIRAAFGDASSTQQQYVTFWDNTTSFASFSNIATGANEFADATGVVRTAAAWPGSNASISRTFTTTTFKIDIGDPSGTDGENTSIAHIYIEEASAGVGLGRNQLVHRFSSQAAARGSFF